MTSLLKQQYALTILVLALVGAVILGVAVTMTMHPTMLTSIMHSIASFRLLPNAVTGHH